MKWPDGFLWGTGASSTQCEGAAPASDWRRWEDAGQAPPSGTGNGFGDRYGEDFTLLAELMKRNPPAAADAPAMERFAGIGLAPGQAVDPARFGGALDRRLPELGLHRAEDGLDVHRQPCGECPFVRGEAAPRLGDVAGAFGLGFGPRRGERFPEPGDAAMAAPAAEHR